MLPDGGPTGSSANQANKRRKDGACDVCRRKKIRCEGAKVPGDPCSSCLAAKLECTFERRFKRRGPKDEYVKKLEKRIEKLEEMLRKLQPDINLHWEELVAEDEQSLSVSESNEPLQSTPASRSSKDDEDDLVHITISEYMKKLEVNDTFKEVKYLGPSSNFMLVKHAMDVSNQYNGAINHVFRKRPRYWEPNAWEQAAGPWDFPGYQLPEPDLLHSLVATYFTHVHITFPLFHEPTFKGSVEAGLHLRDQRFEVILLLVCAVASRYSNDARVIVEGSGSQLSSGWKWFGQVQILQRRSLYDKSSLYDLQFYCLATMFVFSTSNPEAIWTLVGLGIRHAQRLGVHRRRPEGYRSTVDDELKKRAFWILLSIDRLICCNLGRPSAMRDEDFDVEPPVECDDEYWEIDPDSVVSFNQPPDKPSRIAFLNCYSRLGDIMASALGTLYSTKKSKVRMGLIGDQWEQRAVAELDSSLNKWNDSVPDHLRWDAARENPTFLTQSATLYSYYYAIQIQIHRPFIHKPSLLRFSSLAICRNAARSCSHILGAFVLRGVPVMPQPLISAFVCGVVLFLSICEQRQALGMQEPTREVICLQKCVDLLVSAEQRWNMAGRFWDMIHELCSVKEIPLPAYDMPPNQWQLDSESPAPPMLSSDGALPNPITSRQSQEQNPVTEQGPSIHTPAAWDATDPNTGSMYLTSMPGQAHTLATTEFEYPELTGLTAGDSQADFFRDGHTTMEPPFSGMNSAYPAIDTQSNFMSFSPSYEGTDTMGGLDVWSSAPAGFDIQEWGAYIADLGARGL